MKKYKKVVFLLALCFAFVLCLTLTACGSKTKDDVKENVNVIDTLVSTKDEAGNNDTVVDEESDTTVTVVSPNKNYVICEECCLIHTGTKTNTVVCHFCDGLAYIHHFGDNVSIGSSSNESFSETNGVEQSSGHSSSSASINQSESSSFSETHSESISDDTSSGTSEGWSESTSSGSSGSWSESIGESETHTESVGSGVSVGVSQGSTNGTSGSSDKCEFVETEDGYYMICPVTGKKHIVKWAE